MGWVPTTEVFLPDRGEQAKGDSVNVLTNRVSADYFETLNIPVLEGRAFTSRDDEEATRVAVINETMSRAYWQGQSAIGRQLRLEHPQPPVEIVGVVKNSKYRSVGEEPRPCLLPALRAELPVNVNSLLAHRRRSGRRRRRRAPGRERVGSGHAGLRP